MWFGDSNMSRESVHRNLLIPIVFRIQGSNRGSYYKELLQTQWYTVDKINELSLNRVNKLLRHANENVSYYSTLFRGRNFDGRVKTLSDLVKIPILTREDVQNNSTSLLTSNTEDFKIIKSSTGGSTGEPIRFCNTRYAYDYSSADILRHYHWTGLNLGEKHAFLWGAERDSPMNSFKGRLHARALRYIWMNSFKISDSMMNEYSKLLKEHKPKILIGYASSLYAFAKFLEKENIELPAFDGIQSSAEKLFSWQRKTIENQFDAPVFDRYGCREVGNIGHECQEHDGLHISQELMHVEVIKDNEPAAVGEEGDIVLTSFMNYAFPFIRYRTGDTGVLMDSEDTCSCGRSLMRLSTKVGRTSDIFHFEEDVSVHGEYFTHLFYSIPNVRQFQVVQKSKSHLLIRIVTIDQKSTIPENKLTQDILEWVGVQLEVDFEYLERIESTETGKLRFTISEVSNQD